MGIRAIICRFKKSFPKYTVTDGKRTRAGDVDVEADAILGVRKDIADYFGVNTIDIVLPESSKRKGYEKDFYEDLDDATGRKILIGEADVLPRIFLGTGRGIVLETELKTSRGTIRTATMNFPSFFNLVMIQQVLGQMLTKREPGLFKTQKTGKSYLFVKNETKGVVEGRKSGAWIVDALTKPDTNVDDSPLVQADTMVISGRRTKGAWTK